MAFDSTTKTIYAPSRSTEARFLRKTHIRICTRSPARFISWS